MRGTIHYCHIFLSLQNSFITNYFDADWANCQDTCCLKASFSLFLHSNPISYLAKKHPISPNLSSKVTIGLWPLLLLKQSGITFFVIYHVSFEDLSIYIVKLSCRESILHARNKHKQLIDVFTKKLSHSNFKYSAPIFASVHQMIKLRQMLES